MIATQQQSQAATPNDTTISMATDPFLSKAVIDGVYDENQASSYADHKEQPMRTRVELFNTLKYVGDCRGKTMIDVACGSGWLTRHLHQSPTTQASSVVGSDISPEMISLARALTPSTMPIGFQLEDARQSDRSNRVEEQQFDVVTANWLLVHGETKDEVQAMCHGLSRKAKKGAKLVTVVVNPDLYVHPEPEEELNAKSRPFGITFELPPKELRRDSNGNPVSEGELPDGTPMTIQCYTPSGVPGVKLVDYHHSRNTYRSCLEQAGFENIRMIDQKDLQLGPHPSGNDDSREWADFFEVPYMMIILADKA